MLNEAKNRFRALTLPIVEFARRPQVARAVLVLAVLLAIGTYVRNMVYPYEGDAHIYWQAAHASDPYATAVVGHPTGYLYSPAFLEALWPLLQLPWLVFYAIWVAAGTAALFWVAGPWLFLLCFPWVFITFGMPELAIARHTLSSANVVMFYGLAVAAGFRRPWTWALLLLTKVTPGLCLLWFVVRREWRNLAIALGATAAIMAVSFVISPGLWSEWITVLRDNSTYPEPSFAYHILPLVPRLVIAAVMVVVAARYDARWVMPIAVIVAMPYVWDTSLTVLLASFALARHAAWTEPRQPGPERPKAAEAFA